MKGPLNVVMPGSSAAAKCSSEMSRKFGATGKDRCLLFQLVAILAKASLPGGAPLPVSLLGAYLDVVGELASDASSFWELQACGLVQTLCQAAVENSTSSRHGQRAGLDPSARSDRDKSLDRARAGIVSLCAGALCRIATTPMGVQLLSDHEAIWVAAAHLAKKYSAATTIPEQRAEFLRQASGLAMVPDGREALVSSGLPRMVWMELTRELLHREDLGMLLQSDASAYPLLGTLRDLQGIFAWHGSAAALLNEPMKIQAVPDSQKVLRGVVDGLTAGKDTYGNAHPEDTQQVGLQLCCMFMLDAEGLPLLASSTKLSEVLVHLVKSHPNDLQQSASATSLPAAGEKKGKAPVAKANTKARKGKTRRSSNVSSVKNLLLIPQPASNESWVLESIVDMNTASAHALLEAQHTLGGAHERSLVPYPCHIKAASWYCENPPPAYSSLNSARDEACTHDNSANEQSKGTSLDRGAAGGSSEEGVGGSQDPRRQGGQLPKVAVTGVADEIISTAPGMDEATEWWELLQARLIEDLQAETLNFCIVDLLLQRTVMVAMNGRHPADHPFTAISCSRRPPWDSIVTTGSRQGTSVGEAKGGGDQMAVHPLVQKSLARTAAYLERVAAGYYTASIRTDWSAESLTSLQTWAFKACCQAGRAAAIGSSQLRGTDWFVSIVWSIMGPGNTTKEFLAYLSKTPIAIYAWPAWGETVAGSAPAMMLCHLVETVAAEQMPAIVGAFRAASVSMSHILLRWMSQWLVNYLSWEDIVRYTCMVLVMGPDYIVYFMVALLRHCEFDARRHAASADLVPWFMQSQLGSFRLPEYLDYIDTLRADYKAFVLPALIDGSARAAQESRKEMPMDP
eukprot:CAMPEP_0117686486 /NCGR_PEP_ID=MMETSP0804-20121206/22478_1 /TAXON_ID=1074897 /ORGANISM="Tetraselmis astigmatica, Strain CCMP880" /LENGTH=853 /DNA_ID=CAMNT_0005498187 /DNA_START=38 /DNA_END=2599 /DNA_ORIENTATION=-